MPLPQRPIPPGVFGPQPQGPSQGALSPPPPPAAPQRPQQPQRKQSFLDRILGLYGADPATHIPDEQRKSALGTGLFNAGLQTVMAGGRGHDSLTTGQAIGSMLGGLRGTGQYLGAQNTAAAQKQRIQQMIDQGDLGPEQLQAIMMQMLQQGDNEGARTVAEVIKSTAGTQEDRYIKSADPIYDTRKGEWIYPDTGTSMKPDSWQDLGDVKVPVFGVEPDWDHALMKGRNPNSDLRRADSNVKWLASAYEKSIKAVEPSYRLTSTALQAARAGDVEKDGAVQLALLYGFIRALDPNSVVREGEVRLANEAKGLRDLAVSYYNFLAEGDYSKVMAPEQIRQIMDIMGRLEVENQNWLKGQEAYYGQTLGRQLGVPQGTLRDPLETMGQQAGEIDYTYIPPTNPEAYSRMGQEAADRRSALQKQIDDAGGENPLTAELGEWTGLEDN